MESKLTYYSLFSRLKFVTRFSGENLIQPERLESHILEMIGLSMDLWYKFRDFDLNKSIYLICIHDIDETVTVDIPRPFKYFSDKFRKLLNKTTHDYLVSEGFDENFVDDVQSAKSQGKEGKIVSLVDIYQVVKKLKREVALGNSLAKDKLTESNKYLNEMISKNSDLKDYLQYLNSIDELN